jgi:hypothetical protein
MGSIAVLLGQSCLRICFRAAEEGRKNQHGENLPSVHWLAADIILWKGSIYDA